VLVAYVGPRKCRTKLINRVYMDPEMARSKTTKRKPKTASGKRHREIQKATKFTKGSAHAKGLFGKSQ